MSLGYSLYRHSTQGGAERPNVEGHELVREGSSLGLRVFQRLSMCDALRCVVPQRPVRPGGLVSTSVSGQRTTIIGHGHRHRHHLNLQLLKRASPHPEKTDDALGDKPTDGPALTTALRFPSLFPMCTPPAPLASLCPSTSLADLADRTMQRRMSIASLPPAAMGRRVAAGVVLCRRRRGRGRQ